MLLGMERRVMELICFCGVNILFQEESVREMGETVLLPGRWYVQGQEKWVEIWNGSGLRMSAEDGFDVLGEVWVVFRQRVRRWGEKELILLCITGQWSNSTFNLFRGLLEPKFPPLRSSSEQNQVAQLIHTFSTGRGRDRRTLQVGVKSDQTFCRCKHWNVWGCQSWARTFLVMTQLLTWRISIWCLCCLIKGSFWFQLEVQSKLERASVPEMMVGIFKMKGNSNMLLLAVVMPTVPHTSTLGGSMCPPLICPLSMFPPWAVYSPEASFWGCGRGLAVSGEIWEDHVLDDATSNEFGSGLSLKRVEDPLLMRLLLDTQLCPADKSLWSIKHSLVICHASILWKSS